METTIFYTFMGINVIRKGGAAKCRFVPGGTMGAIPGMSFVASWMMRKKINEAGIPALDELMEIAQLEGVKFVACKMTVDMMGLSQEDFIEGVEIQTAEDLPETCAQLQNKHVHLTSRGWISVDGTWRRLPNSDYPSSDLSPATHGSNSVSPLPLFCCSSSPYSRALLHFIVDRTVADRLLLFLHFPGRSKNPGTRI